MRGGIRSRRLAAAISAQFGANAEEIRTRLADIGLSGWRAQFGAYPSELRDLLDYVRREPQLVCDVLDGLGATIGVVGPAIDTPLSGEASVIEDASEPEPKPLLVMVDDQQQGLIPSDSYQDLRQLLDVGLHLTFNFDHTTRELTVDLDH
jgi:hypothetical protein